MSLGLRKIVNCRPLSVEYILWKYNVSIAWIFNNKYTLLVVVHNGMQIHFIAYDRKHIHILVDPFTGINCRFYFALNPEPLAIHNEMTMTIVWYVIGTVIATI